MISDMMLDSNDNIRHLPFFSFEIGKQKALEFLETYKTKEVPTKEQLYQVALTSLSTKVFFSNLPF